MITQVLYKLFFFVFLIVFVTIAGCTTVRDVVIDAVPEDDSMVDAVPVKIIMFIDYPIGGKDAYIAWVSSVAATLQAPKEVKRIRSYDNQDQTMSPNRLVEFEFESFLDSATYLNRPEISDVLLDIPNYTSVADVHIYIERSDYERSDEADYPIKFVSLIDYPLGGKDEYLAWVASVSSTLVDPPQVKTISSYDNYYGESPHRLFAIEFSSQEDADTYEALEEIQAIEDELDVRAGSWSSHTFELRSDYINE